MLNVGGVTFTTRLSTLTKYRDSLLGAMFSGMHTVARDSDGQPFIDSNPDYFRHILEYLRHETLPPAELEIPMYQQACYYSITALVERLKTTAAVSTMLVNEEYRNRFPDYKEVKHRIITNAMKSSITKFKRGAVYIHAANKLSETLDCDYQHHDDLIVLPSRTDNYEEDMFRCLFNDLFEEGFAIEMTYQFQPCKCKGFGGILNIKF